jgi:hypothetical protein
MYVASQAAHPLFQAFKQLTLSIRWFPVPAAALVWICHICSRGSTLFIPTTPCKLSTA